MVDFNELKDQAAARARDLRSKAENYVDENRDKIDDKLEQAGDFVGKKTGKGEQADKAVGKVKGFLDRNPATDGKPDAPA